MNQPDRDSTVISASLGRPAPPDQSAHRLEHSTDATPGHVRRLLASRAAAYLTKPFAIHEVLAVVDRTLAGSRRARQHPQKAEPGA
jgi:DNA-binding NarL/FixJ family response regulator